MIPYVVNWLIIPAVLTSTLNVFNKISSLLSDLCRRYCANYWHHYDGDIYETVYLTLKWTLCILLSISFTESVYLSLQYGVAHYRIMHQVNATVGLANEVLLISAIALSTFHTMSRVASTMVSSIMWPLQQIRIFTSQLSEIPNLTLVVKVWGYFTVFIRSLVRGLQTASLGQGAKLVVVNYTDKADRNAVAFWYENMQSLSSDSNNKAEYRNKPTSMLESVKSFLGFAA